MEDTTLRALQLHVHEAGSNGSITANSTGYWLLYGWRKRKQEYQHAKYLGYGYSECKDKITKILGPTRNPNQ